MPTLLEKLQAWIDPKLESTFNEKPHDPTRERDWVVMRLQSAKTQFAATESTRGGGKRWWKLSNGVVSFSPIRRDGQPLVVNGQTTLFIPSEHYSAFLDTMVEAVNAGDFDKELASNTPAGTSVALNTTPRVRKPREPKAPGEGGRDGWSQERRDRFAASIAARKAAKANA